MWLVGFYYIFKCDWLIKLSDNKLSNNKLSNNKLSDNNLVSELVENRTFLNQWQLPMNFSFIWKISLYVQDIWGDNKNFENELLSPLDQKNVSRTRIQGS